MNLSAYKLGYAIPLYYRDKLIAYRVYSVDDEFTDVSVKDFTSYCRTIGVIPLGNAQKLVLCSDKYLRTQHENFGVVNKLIKIARHNEELTWYIWRRPQFVQLATKIVKDIRNNFSVEDYYIGEERADIRVNFSVLNGEGSQEECVNLGHTVSGFIVSKYGGQLRKLGFNMGTLYTQCQYHCVDDIYSYLFRADTEYP